LEEEMFPYNRSVELIGTGATVKTGWLPPLPDMRDYGVGHREIVPMFEKLGLSSPPTVPTRADLRPWCSPVENQGDLGSCTAHAAAGIVEYFQSRGFDKHIDASRLFIYKATRNLMQVTGDTGSWLRNTMGALVLCGVAPEKYWPYDIAKFDVEPTSFVYSVADNYETLKYFCLDPSGGNVDSDKVLDGLKSLLAAGIPAMFGFYGFPSFSNAEAAGDIPYPCPDEKAEWGHAIVAVGYDDEKKVTNTRCDVTTTGALLIRNSWGVGWGDGGYGWLPYRYVLDRLAMDFWVMLSMKWVDTQQFGFE
jgi:C1A family cysteine protease